MSFSGAFNFFAGDEDLSLHELFSFGDTYDGAADNVLPPADSLFTPPQGSSFTTSFEDLRGQPGGWLSPSAAGHVDGLDTIKFDDFLILDESTNDLPTAAEEAPSSLLPEVTASGAPHEKFTAAADNFEDLEAVMKLKAAQAEIAQLKAALVTSSSRLRLVVTPGGSQSSGSPRKRESTDGEVSPPKKQTTTQVGPIEALWSPKVTGDERRAFHENLDSPTTPKPFPAHLDFTPQLTSVYSSNPQDVGISAEDLHSIQAFLHDNPALVHGTSCHIDTSTTPSSITTPHPADMKVKRVPLRHAFKPLHRVSTSATSKITKKPKTNPKKTQHQRTTSTAYTTAPSAAPPAYPRSIDELLAANFYSLNEQEKTRVLLPLLRNLDPRALEASLAALPCIQAKGPGHEVRVARAIHDSPPTPEDDDILATKLTFGTPPSPAQSLKAFTPQITPLQTPAFRASPLSHKIAKVEVNENLGITRQREALEKAALLQVQGKKH